MLDKLLNGFKEKMIAEDISNNTIKNYISDIRNFYKWYKEISFSENGYFPTKVTKVARTNGVFSNKSN